MQKDRPIKDLLKNNVHTQMDRPSRNTMIRHDGHANHKTNITKYKKKPFTSCKQRVLSSFGVVST